MKILLLGAQGQLGWELGAALSPLGQVFHLSRHQANLARLDELEKVARQVKAEVIVNAAAYTRVDLAEDEAEQADLINAQAPALLARLARETQAWLVHYSTDYVFDGLKDGPYLESDAAAPLNVYGRSKLAGDEAIMASGCRHLIFRTSWVFSEKGENFARTILKLARKEKRLTVVSDQVGSPTSVELLAGATALALRESLTGSADLSGLYNLVSEGYTSWHGFAVYLLQKARALGWQLTVGENEVIATATEAGVRPARRPANSRLSTEKFQKTFQLTPPHWSYYADRLLWTLTRDQARQPQSETPHHILGLKFIPPGNSLTRF